MPTDWPEKRKRLEGWIGRYENGGCDSEDDWNIAADMRAALSRADRIDALEAHVLALQDQALRQDDELRAKDRRIDALEAELAQAITELEEAANIIGRHRLVASLFVRAVETHRAVLSPAPSAQEPET